MQILSNIRNYEVKFEDKLDFLNELTGLDNFVAVIDKNIFELYRVFFTKIPKEFLYILEAKEQNKNIDTALEICEKITDISAKRNATLLSIGGGIVQDITGFVANIMYRGINWIFVPTTLLSACDSCIGGKTSLNYKKYKNLLGTFYPPNNIYICSEFFYTLSAKDFNSGLGEVIKFNIMAGENGLVDIEKNIDKLISRNPEIVNDFVKSSLSFKKKFIEIDEFDRGERIKLNFAHTFGHAIEVVTDYDIPHGTAVAIGMIMADYISYNRGYLEKSIITRSEEVLLKVIDINISLLKKPTEEYLRVICKDKKQTNNSLTTVLITKYGIQSELSIVNNTLEKEIEDAIKYFIYLYEKKGNRIKNDYKI